MRPPRIRLRTLMIAVAAVGLAIWSRKMHHRAIELRATAKENARLCTLSDQWADIIAKDRRQIDEFAGEMENTEHPRHKEFIRARITAKEFEDHYRGLARHYEMLARKYDRLSSYPWLHIAPDPPLPGSTEEDDLLGRQIAGEQ